MKAQKKTFWILLWTTVVTFIITFIIFASITPENWMREFFKNFLIGAFASLFVSLIVTYTAYENEKDSFFERQFKNTVGNYIFIRLLKKDIIKLHEMLEETEYNLRCSKMLSTIADKSINFDRTYYSKEFTPLIINKKSKKTFICLEKIDGISINNFSDLSGRLLNYSYNILNKAITKEQFIDCLIFEYTNVIQTIANIDTVMNELMTFHNFDMSWTERVIIINGMCIYEDDTKNINDLIIYKTKIKDVHHVI